MADNTLYANVGPDGIIVFEKAADPSLGRLPVLIGEAKKVVAVVKRWASLHPDGETYYLPDVQRQAYSYGEKVDRLLEWRRRLTAEMERIEIVDLPA